MKKKNRSLEARRQKEGYILVAPLALGILLFFIFPVISSFIYSFSEVSIEVGSVVTKFVGLKNYRYALLKNSQYSAYLPVALGKMFSDIPMILALSLVLAVILNQKFFGRTFARAIFFLPVIITSSTL